MKGNESRREERRIEMKRRAERTICRFMTSLILVAAQVIRNKPENKATVASPSKCRCRAAWTRSCSSGATQWFILV